MFAMLHTPADLTFQYRSPKAMLARILAAIAASQARAQTRRDYRRLLGDEAAMRDVGVTAAEVRKAMRRLDDRA